MAQTDCLVVYYSLTGHTRAAAQVMANVMSADIEEVRPIGQKRSTVLTGLLGSLASWRKRAWPVESSTRSFEKYRILVVGGPIWMGDIAPPVRGWLESHRLSSSMLLGLFVTAQRTPQPAVFSDLAALARRRPAATLAITGSDRAAGRVADLIADFARSLTASAGSD